MTISTVPPKMSLFQWMAPELVREGIVKANNDWVVENTHAAEQLFGHNQALQVVAVSMAAGHRYGLDYIKQAPVLVVAMTREKTMLRRRERAVVAKMFRDSIEKHPKLRDLMLHHGVSLPLRALHSTSLAPVRWKAVKALADLARKEPSRVAQIIPTFRQSTWLSSLTRWQEAAAGHMRRAGAQLGQTEAESARELAMFGWAAGAIANVKLDGARDHERDVYDWLSNNREEFERSAGRLTWMAARERANAWHAELARKTEDEKWFARHGLSWDARWDIGRLPLQVQINNLTFHALNSAALLHEEGRAMRHCVSSYRDAAIKGRCHIYGVRSGETRIATVEFQVVAYKQVILKDEIGPRVIEYPPQHDLAVQYLDVPVLKAVQVQGPCNQPVRKDVAQAIQAFVARVGKAETL